MKNLVGELFQFTVLFFSGLYMIRYGDVLSFVVSLGYGDKFLPHEAVALPIAGVGLLVWSLWKLVNIMKAVKMNNMKGYLALFILFVLFFSSIATVIINANPDVGYEETGIAALPLDENEKYVIFAWNSGSTVYFKAYDKTNDRWICEQSWSISYSDRFQAVGKLDGEIAILVIVTRYYQYGYFYAYKINLQTGLRYSSSFNIYGGTINGYVSPTLGANLIKTASNTYYVACYWWAFDGYTNINHYDRLYRLTTTENSISITTAVSRSWMGGDSLEIKHHIYYFSYENKILTIYCYGSSTPRYGYFDLSSSTFTEIIEHPYANRYVVKNLPYEIVKTEVVYSEGKPIWHISVIKSKVVSGYRTVYVIHHKLVFNNTVTAANLLGQYEEVMTINPNFGGGQSQASFAFGYQAGQSICVFYSNYDGGNKISRIIVSMNHYDDLENPVDFEVVSSEVQAPGYSEVNALPTDTVFRILWSDDWLIHYNGYTFLWYGLPPVYTSWNLTVEFSPAIQNNTIVRGTEYNIMVTILGDDNPVYGAAVYLYDNRTGVLSPVDTSTTNINGRAYLDLQYIDEEINWTHLLINATYFGDPVPIEWEDEYELSPISWDLNVTWYPYDDPLYKDTRYQFTARLTWCGIPYSGVMISVTMSNSTVIYARMTTDRNGQVVWYYTPTSLSDFDMNVTAIRNNVVVAEWTREFAVIQRSITEPKPSIEPVMGQSIDMITAWMIPAILLLAPSMIFGSKYGKAGMVIGMVIGAICLSFTGAMPLWVYALIGLGVLAFIILSRW